MNQPLNPFPLKNTIAPFENVNASLVNKDASNWVGGFGSKETSLQFGLPSMRNNVQAAAASKIQSGGGRKILRKKIKNIANKYRISMQKRKAMKRSLMRSMKLKGGYLATKHRRNRLVSSSSGFRNSSATGTASIKKMKNRGKGIKGKTRKYKMNGGTYHQYGSQIPNTPSYSTPGFSLPASQLALANPPPFQKINGNCVDNYNHFTNKGFTFW